MAHNIIDSDARFSINSVTRQIKNESKQKTSLMQNDHNSERFGFILDRYIEGHDMSLCNQVEVHYLNSSSKDKKREGIMKKNLRSETWQGQFATSGQSLLRTFTGMET